MIGKIIGAFVGDRIARQTSGVGGATGAVMGVAATSLFRRMSIPAMIAIAAGGYALKKLADKGAEAKAEAATKRKPKAKVKPRTT